MTRSSNSTDSRIVRGAAEALPCAVGAARQPARQAPSAPGASAAIRALSSPAGMSSPASIAATISPIRSMIASTALTSAPSGMAAAGADVGERILGGMAQRLEPREFEEAAIALHGVNEAENAIEPRAVVGLRLPRRRFRRPGLRASRGIRLRNRQSDRPSALRPPAMVRRPYAGQELTRRYPCRTLNALAARRECAPISRTSLAGSERLDRAAGSGGEADAPARLRRRGARPSPLLPSASVSRSAGSSRMRGPSARIDDLDLAVAVTRPRHRAGRRAPARRRRSGRGSAAA